MKCIIWNHIPIKQLTTTTTTANNNNNSNNNLVSYSFIATTLLQASLTLHLHAVNIHTYPPREGQDAGGEDENAAVAGRADQLLTDPRAQVGLQSKSAHDGRPAKANILHCSVFRLDKHRRAYQCVSDTWASCFFSWLLHYLTKQMQLSGLMLF